MKTGGVSSSLLISAVAVLSVLSGAEFLDARKASGTAQFASVSDQYLAEVRRPIATVEGAHGRPMVPEDLFAIRTYGEKSVSPDGQMIALEIRGWARGAMHDSGGVFRLNRRSELWLVLRHKGERRRLTPTQPVQLSHWNPVWSPDSKRLAFLSTEARDNAFLEVWERSTGHIRRLANAGVDMKAGMRRGSSDADESPMLWLDDTHILVVLLPNGYRSRAFDENSRSLAIASAGARQAAEGKEPTPVVAFSPPDPTRKLVGLQARLMIIDTRTGSLNMIGEMPGWETRMAKREVIVSPNARWAALLVTVPPGTIDAQAQWSSNEMQWTRLGFAPLDSQAHGIHWVEGFRPAPYNNTHLSIAPSWQARNSMFAVLGRQGGEGTAVTVAGVDVSTGQWHSMAVIEYGRFGKDGLPPDIRSVAWLRNGGVAVRVRNPREPDEARRDRWWLTAGDSAIPLAPEQELENGDASQGVSESDKLHTGETGRLYENDGAGMERTLFQDLNPQLEESSEPRSIAFEYKGLGGETLHADLLLPYGYVKGTRYPTVVWVYGGGIRSGKGQPAHREDDDFLNLMFLVGHGYAVLIPSMPLPLARVPSDPLEHLNDGVDPAVDRAIELGIVDSDRLALMGHSYGGYSVFGLLTQTHRYRAGIGMMGVSDVATFFGEFDPRYRYSDPNYAAGLGPWFAESSQGRMGVPPWADPDRYVRNSPMFAANRITTPLLIVTGDLDFTASQCETMFTVLHRQGKRVEFIRYLGEEHELDSPANILDLWQRVFGWLDIYVKSDRGNGQLNGSMNTAPN